ncbi:uncharacterized protein LOC129611476 [Condylostylus longicornis]|uniref:uncharacterized protein LOC129611476 n=1 Tax=Condylostylus longicornis TaxID=2530218 RepID=UPI00244E5023|nr:uncharacterized protein LOC129611476 [Condylostylus longicornis]
MQKRKNRSYKMKFLMFLITCIGLFKENLCIDYNVKVIRHIYHNGQILSEIPGSQQYLALSSSSSPSSLSSSPSSSQKLSTSSSLTTLAQKKFFDIEKPIFEKEFQNQNNKRTHFTTAINSNQLLILDGINLYLFRTIQNSTHFDFIAKFKNRNDEKIDMFEAILFENNLILVIAASDFIEIYQINYHIIENELLNLNNTSKNYENDTPLIHDELERLQRIHIIGHLHKIFLFGTEKSKMDTSNLRRPRSNEYSSVYLIASIKFNVMEGKLSTYKWSESTFYSVDKKSIKPFDDIYLVKSSETDIIHILTSKFEEESEQTSVIVYKFIKRKETFKKILSNFFDSHLIQIFGFNNEIIVSECFPEEHHCNYFKIVQEQFKQYKITVGTEAAILNGTYCEKIASFQAKPSFITCINENKLHIFGDEKFEALILPNITLDENIIEINNFIDNFGKKFLFIIYKKDNTKILLKIYVMNKLEEIAIIGDARTAISIEKQLALEHYITNVRNLLIGREKTIQQISNLIQFLRKYSPTKENEKKILKTKSHIVIPEGRIKSLNILNDNFTSTLKEMKSNVKELKNIISQIKTSVHRPKRDTMKKPKPMKIKNLKVKNMTIIDQEFSSKLLNQILTSVPSNNDNNTLIFKNSVEVDILNVKESSDIEKLKNFDKFRQDAPIMFNLMDNRNFTGSMKFKNIQVREINGINWDNMYENEMLRDDQISIIKGNLKIVSTDKPNIIEVLNTRRLNFINVSDIFTMNTEQNIHSNILISRFLIQSLELKKLNNLDIVNDIARIDRENNITSPVEIEKISILNHLHLDEENERIFARHIFGTKHEDFQQIYTGNITINGDVTLHNINGNDENTRFIIGDQMLEGDFSKNFWLKHIDQQIEHPIKFTSFVNLTEVETRNLNDFPLEDYLLWNKNPNKPINLFFKNARVIGNITVNNSESQIKRIANQATSDITNIFINNTKNFMSGLRVNELSTQLINDIRTSDLVKKSTVVVNDFEEKTFQNLNVLRNFTVDSELIVERVNNIINVTEYLDQYIKIVMERINDTTSSSKEMLNLQIILFKNDNNPEEPVQLENKITFKNKVVIDNVFIDKINDRLISDLFNNILKISIPQIITGKWIFNNTKIRHLQTSFINNIHTSLLLDVEASDTHIHSWEPITYGCLEDINAIIKLDNNYNKKSLHKIHNDNMNNDNYDEEILLIALAKTKTLALKPVIQN